MIQWLDTKLSGLTGAWLAAVILVFGAGLFLVLRFVVGGPEDDWICRDGTWVKHGQPLAPAPTSVCRGSK